MKKLLIPTDFSTEATNALKISAQLAKKNNCEIHILHMLEIPSQMNDALNNSVGIPEIMLFIKKTKEKLAEISNADFLEGITVIQSIEHKGTSEGILTYSKKNDIDLIIMGSHGITGLNELLIGSNTEKIVRLSNVPVLVVKNDTFETNKPTFVFASDFSNETKKSFEKMILFANAFDAKLKLVTICTPNSFKTTALSKKIMTDYITEFEITDYTTDIYNDTNVENGILNYATENNADLIGLCTHGRTGLIHFFTGSIGEDLANHATKPVITFRI